MSDERPASRRRLSSQKFTGHPQELTRRGEWFRSSHPARERAEVAEAHFDRRGAGGVVVRLFGDLRRHDMGPGLAESIDETGAGASVWMTKELWGVGTSDPYLHDGRATTLTEAILEHGGEAAGHSADFNALSDADQADLIAFLSSLTIFLPPEG